MKYSLVLQSEARKLFIFSFQSPSRVNRGCSKPSQPPPPRARAKFHPLSVHCSEHEHFLVFAFPAQVPPSQTPSPEATAALQSLHPSPHPPPIHVDQTAGPAAASLVDSQLQEAARQQRLDAPISSYPAGLGREAARECKHSLLRATPVGLPSPTGPSVAFSFLPKITIGFNGSLGVNQAALMRARGSLRTGRTCYPSLLPQCTRTKVSRI